MRVAIIGSRYKEADASTIARVRAAVFEYVEGLPPGTQVISGGAEGVDTWAAMAALQRDDLPRPIIVRIRKPYLANGKPVKLSRAQFAVLAKNRNQKVVDMLEKDEGDYLTAFHDGESGGTIDGVIRAKKADVWKETITCP